MEKLSPIPPKVMMKARRSKNTPFWHNLIGGRGGPDISFILSNTIGNLSAFDVVTAQHTKYCRRRMAVVLLPLETKVALDRTVI